MQEIKDGDAGFRVGLVRVGAEGQRCPSGVVVLLRGRMKVWSVMLG